MLSFENNVFGIFPNITIQTVKNSNTVNLGKNYSLFDVKLPKKNSQVTLFGSKFDI